MTRKTPSQGYQEARLLAAMAEEGCPICHDAAGSDDRFFFWFFTENYYETFTLDALTRSLGFCLAHGGRLARTSGGSYQLAAVHEVLIRRVRAQLGDPTPLTSHSLCPACQDRKDLVARSAFVMARLIESPSGAERYGQPGILCFPHLQAVSPRISALTLDRLLAVHEAAGASAVAALAERETETGRFPSAGRQDLAKELLPSLRLVVGHDPGDGIYPAREGPVRSSSPRDPVGDFVELLRRAVACPVCLEVGRAWVEWMEWLDDVVPGGEAG